MWATKISSGPLPCPLLTGLTLLAEESGGWNRGAVEHGQSNKASVGIPTIGTVECQPQNSFGFSQKGISCKRGWNLSGMGAVRSYVLWNTGCFFLRMAMENQSHPCHATLLLSRRHGSTPMLRIRGVPFHGVNGWNPGGYHNLRPGPQMA